MIIKLAPTTLRRIITIKKLNNIIINCLQNPNVCLFLDKWYFDLSQDWEILILNYENFNADAIAKKTLQALGFHISIIGHLEKKFLYFTNITNLKLFIKQAMVDILGQVVINFEKNIVKKKNKCVANR